MDLREPRRRRVALLLVLTVLTAAAAATPRVNAPFGRVANYDADPGIPITTAVVDIGAVKRARPILPHGSRYFIHVGAAIDNAQLDADLVGVTLLYLAPSIPVHLPKDATWVLSYKAAGSLPAGLTARHRYALGDDVYLVDVR